MASRADALRAMANAATKGPWGVGVRATFKAAVLGVEVCGVIGPKDEHIAVCGEHDAQSLSDSAFIAASREAVPALLDTVKALRAIIRRTNDRGGLGYVIHDELRAALAASADWEESDDATR